MPRDFASQPSRRLADYVHPQGLAWLSVAAMLASLGSARSVLSIGLGTLVAAVLWDRIQRKQRLLPPRAYGWIALGAGALFGAAVLSGWQTDTLADWGTDMTRKLPYLIIPLTLYLLPPFTRSQLNGLAWVFVLSQTVVALISLAEYALTYEATLDRVAENSSVGVSTGVSHIYFGTILAFAVCVSLYMALRRTQVWHAREPQLWALFAALNFLALHLFTSRTGLIALYGGLGLGGLYYLIERKVWWLGALFLGLMVLSPILAYQFVPSFRLRVEVTRWDVMQYQNPEADISYNSASLRLMAWETAWELIRQRPLLGVGMGDVKPEMRAAYTRNGSYQRAKAPLAEPHNQYLNLAVGLGLGGVLLLLGCLALLVGYIPPPGRMLAVAFVGLMMAALMFESILERQIGMTLWTLSYMLIPLWGTLFQPPGENGPNESQIRPLRNFQ